MGTANKVQEAGLILGGLGVIGFIGVIWIMIYGNLSGNLGFVETTNVVTNETGLESVTGTDVVAAFINPLQTHTFTITDAWAFELEDGLIQVNSSFLAFLSIDSNGVLSNSTQLNSTTFGNLSLSYSNQLKGQGEVSTENVISNITGGFGTFFTFSNTFFTIAAIVLLIFMLLGLLALVMSIIKTSGGKGRGFSGQ